MYGWDWTPRTGWRWKQQRKTPPANYEIWRQAKDAPPKLIIALDNRRAVIDTMAKLEQAEHDRGAETVKHRESMDVGEAGGFTVSTMQTVVVHDDQSGKPRSRMANAPCAHYWVEAVFPNQCETENARYRKTAWYRRNAQNRPDIGA